MIYKIKDVSLEVICKIKEFEELVYGRFSQFEKIDRKDQDNYLKISKEKIEIKIGNQKKELNGVVLQTDLYTVINNVLSFIIDDENNIYMHSVVVSNKNKGLLILGNFGQGKTTLANEFVKNDFKINSTDQTWLKIENNTFIQVLGSRFYIEDGKIKYISKNDSDKKVNIDEIIRIVGLCNNGDLTISKPKNIFSKVKQISDYATWSYNSVLFTDDIELYNINEKIKPFLMKLEQIPLYNVRGDKRSVVKNVYERGKNEGFNSSGIK